MNLRDLKYLLALVDHQHFGKAADACFVSQPALSMQIKKLETTLGTKLLERTNKSVLLTPIGIVIADKARQIVNQVNEIHEIAKLAKDPYQGELKLGIFPTLAPYLLPLIMPSLVKSFPRLEFYLIEEQTDSLALKLKTGQIDAAFLALPLPITNIESTTLFEEEFMLALEANHKLAKRPTLKQHDLADENLLLLDEGHCLRNQALAVCNKMRAHESQNFRGTSLETLRHMVAAGVGMTLMPKLSCHATKNMTYIPFSKPKPSRTIALAWRTSTAKTLLLNEIANHIKKLMATKK